MTVIVINNCHQLMTLNMLIRYLKYICIICFIIYLNLILHKQNLRFD